MDQHEEKELEIPVVVITTFSNATEGNFWGDYDGPYHDTNRNKSTTNGVEITNYVTYWVDGFVPVKSVTGVSIYPTFEWEAPTSGLGPSGGTPPTLDSYRLVVSENSDLSNDLFDDNVGNNFSKTMDETSLRFPLANNKKYYWKVIGYNGNDSLYSSDINYFHNCEWS
ncbi:MAG: hypothetical protein U5K00_00570 [Melioribacteraceae bacterium]|nr:hypothetical protein [Melioribacteraceae bacterium]